MNLRIQQNLIDFYLEFKTENDFYKDDSFYSFLSKWPNCNIHKLHLNEVKKKLDFTKKHYSKNWILTDDFISIYKEQIKKHKLFPVKNWTNMYHHQTTEFITENKTDFKVSQVKNNEWNTFMETINSSFNKEILHRKNIQNITQNDNFTCFVGKYKNKIVSTAVFYNNLDCIGLYFITTKKDMQKKGFASETIKTGMNHFIKKGQTEFVLHATENGIKLYKNLGFIPVNKMRIFVKI